MEAAAGAFRESVKLARDRIGLTCSAPLVRILKKLLSFALPQVRVNRAARPLRRGVCVRDLSSITSKTMNTNEFGLPVAVVR